MTQSYNADSLTVLQGLDAVRKRPGMYIGSTSSRGLQHLLWEIADNSVDEALAGNGDRIDITLHEDGSVEVADFGRGMPIDTEKTTGKSGVVVIFTELHGGGKFGGGAYGSTGGLHGVGATVVNALSTRLDVEVHRNGKRYTLGFKDGEPGHYSETGSFRAGAKPKAAGTTDRTGTTVRFWPDRDIFEKDAEFSWDSLVHRARQTAFLSPGLRMTVTDLRNPEEGEKREEFLFDGGTRDFVEYLAPGNMLTPVVTCTGEGTYTESVPVQDPDTGKRVTQDVERTMSVDVSLAWTSTFEPTIQSFVNIVETPKGGTHVNGFERSLTKTLNTYLRESRTLKQSDADVVKSDVLEGLTAVVLVRIPEPQFEGQTKEILGTGPASRIVAKVMADGLKEFFETPRSRAAAKVALEKVSKAAKVRLSARAQRENLRRKNALGSSSMPAKLKDCRTHNLEESELFVIEGDSAGGSAAQGRDSETQALIPLRGKVINVLKATEAKVLKNAEYAALITAMGAGVGNTFDIEAIRYGKLIIMADADSDGDHIRLLLLTFVWKYMRPLFDAGRVYSAVPPLYEIKKKSGKGPTQYAYTPDEMKAILAKAPKGSLDAKRLKGLGEQNADSLAETTMAKKTRKLRRITVEDMERVQKALEVLMGKDPEPRRDFIVERSGLIPKDQLDLAG